MEKIKNCLLKSIAVLMIVSLTVGALPAGSKNVSTVYADTTVYVTKTGKKYHSHKCGNGNYYKSTLSKAKSRGLTACKKCYGSNPPSDSSSASKKKSTIKLNCTSKVLVAGQSVKLKLKGTSSKIKWKSSNKKIASVTSKGKVTARRRGKVTITATAGKTKKKCKVVVENPRISQARLTMQEGESASLYVIGCSHDAQWSSGNYDVADVYDGEIESYEAGTTTITAKVHGKRYRCIVTVLEAGEKSVNY